MSIERRLINFLESARLRDLAAVVTLLAFAMLYDVGSTRGWGLKAIEGSIPGFGNCLYFSIVTFTSLGYGDLSPVGFGKALACMEVIVGLSFFGVGVAKLSSYKQSYLLTQLYARDVQQGLDQFALEVRKIRSLYNTTKVAQ